MFGMLLATVYAEESVVTPSAYAIAHVLTNPVTRESAVEIDMIAVERAMVGLSMVTSRRMANVCVPRPLVIVAEDRATA